MKTDTTKPDRCERCSERESDPSILCGLMVPPDYCRAKITTPSKTLSEKAREVSANLIAHTTSVHNVNVIKKALEEAYLQGRVEGQNH